MPPDEPNDEERLEKLPEDNQTPFNAAAPARDQDLEVDDDAQPTSDLDDTHPATDSNVEREDVYEGGVTEATQATEPNAGNAVVDYDKPEDVQPS